jgi:hypothetical protein
MIKKLLSTLVLAAVAVAFTGCGDDVKKEQHIQMEKQSEPEMVSPGEPIVE